MNKPIVTSKDGLLCADVTGVGTVQVIVIPEGDVCKDERIILQFNRDKFRQWLKETALQLERRK